MSASNRAIVQRVFIDGLNSHDVTVVMELYSDAVCHFPLVGELKGEAVRRFFASLLSAFPDIQRRSEDQFTDDLNHVVTRWTATGTHLGDFMGIAPTGNRVTVTGIAIHRIASGQIVEEWQEWDTLGLMQQLGVVPTFKFETLAA
jgi:steroid delta-isomerase-like uncharacterized protein